MNFGGREGRAPPVDLAPFWHGEQDAERQDERHFPFYGAPPPVRLYLVRHGIAEEKGGKADAERTLTNQGRKDVAAVALALAGLVERPVKILSSPYLRAEQTAEIVRETLKVEEKLRVTDALSPESDWPTLRALLEEAEEDDAASVIAVGHNPSMSEICAAIVAGTTDARIALAKGAAACIELDDLHGRPAGELKWILTPSTIRAAFGEGPKAKAR